MVMLTAQLFPQMKLNNPFFGGSWLGRAAKVRCGGPWRCLLHQELYHPGDKQVSSVQHSLIVSL
jgi:hypothetical protein